VKQSIKLLGLKSFLIVSIGRICFYFLRSIHYYDIHKPRIDEIIFFINNGYKAELAGNLICASQLNRNQKYLIRPGTSDKLVFNQIFIEQEYLPLINLITACNAGPSIRTIIDAGSNIGLATLFFKQHYPDAKIVSLEPDPVTKTYLEKNIKLNDFKDSVIVVNKALWHNSSDKIAMCSSFRDGESWSRTVQFDNNPDNEIETATLTDLIKLHFDNDVIDVLKIDIEGSEKFLFENQHFINTISNNIRFLSLEIHNELNIRSNIIQTLIDNNFQIFHVGETTFCFNKILVRESGSISSYTVL
jgi:FkbM family methyltransferase